MVRKKLNEAYCPPKNITENPVMDIIEYVIFPNKGEFNLKRSEKYGGNIDYLKVSELKESYTKGLIHPLDLKKSTEEMLNSILDGIRQYFHDKSEAQKILDRMKELEITR